MDFKGDKDSSISLELALYLDCKDFHWSPEFLASTSCWWSDFLEESEKLESLNLDL